FFFFQAEDGIRYDLVTGVQTCALPIYEPLKAFTQITHRAPMLSLDNTYSEEEVAAFYRRMERLLPNEKIPVVVEPKVDGVAVSRSEERRVGKRWRQGGVAVNEKESRVV